MRYKVSIWRGWETRELLLDDPLQYASIYQIKQLFKSQLNCIEVLLHIWPNASFTLQSKLSLKCNLYISLSLINHNHKLPYTMPTPRRLYGKELIDFCCNYYIHVLFTTTGVFPFLYCMVGTQHQSHWHHSWDMTPNLIQHIFNPGLQNYKTQLAQTAYSQKLHCDQHTKKHTFVAGDSVWLPILTAGKLDPRWEGERAMKCMKSPIPAEVCNGWHTIVVYANRLQYSFAPGWHETAVSSDIEHAHECTDWAPPSVKHVLLLPVNQTMMTRYLRSIRRPFHWYRL